MDHATICRGYSDETLAGIIRQLKASGDWPKRLKAAAEELERRRQELRR
jgi:hypothetical protein